MDDESITEIIESTQSHPITVALAEAKDRGNCPIAKVIMENGKVGAVIVQIEGLSWYFHETNGPDGKLLVYQINEGNRVKWVCPYDGPNVVVN